MFTFSLLQFSALQLKDVGAEEGFGLVTATDAILPTFPWASMTKYTARVTPTSRTDTVTHWRLCV